MVGHSVESIVARLAQSCCKPSPPALRGNSLSSPIQFGHSLSPAPHCTLKITLGSVKRRHLLHPLHEIQTCLTSPHPRCGFRMNIFYFISKSTHPCPYKGRVVCQAQVLTYQRSVRRTNIIKVNLSVKVVRARERPRQG